MPQRIDQGLALGLGADGDAQVVVDAGLLEVAHEDAALAQGAEQVGRARAGVAHEQEVGARRQAVETQAVELLFQPLAAGGKAY